MADRKSPGFAQFLKEATKPRPEAMGAGERGVPVVGELNERNERYMSIRRIGQKFEVSKSRSRSRRLALRRSTR